MALQAPALFVPDNRFDRFRQQEQFIENWLYYASAQEWTLTTADSATAALQVATAGNQGGNMLVSAAGATANDEAYLFLTTSRFIFADGATFSVKGKVKFAQAATNNAAIHFGLMSAPAANTIVDTTGVPKSSFSGAIIYSKAGSLYWQGGCSVGTALQSTASNKVAGGTLAQELRIDIKCTNGVADIQYFVDEEALLDESTAWSQPIKHSLTYSGAVAMTGYFGMKQCSAAQQTALLQGYAHGIAYGSW